jgi:predicted phosphodiesterase
MTKVLVISDVHANITALEAVLADAGKVDEVWCLGDIAGYGPDPNECMQRIRLAKTYLYDGQSRLCCYRQHAVGGVQR